MLLVSWKVSSYHPPPDRSELFQLSDELDINIFMHVDGGLLFGPSIEIFRLVELVSNQVMMRIVGRMERLGDQNFFLDRVIARTALECSVEANPRCIRDVIAVLGLDSRPVATLKCQENTNDRVTGRTGERETSCVQAVGKLLYLCQERVDIMYSVNETARKITCPTESDEMNVKSIARYLKKCPESKVFDRDQHIPTERERVHRQRLGKTAPNVKEHKRWSYAMVKAQLFLHGQEHNSQ